MHQVKRQQNQENTKKPDHISVLTDLSEEDWLLVLELSKEIAQDMHRVPRLLEISSKVNAGIYHVNKDLLIEALLKKNSSK